MFHLHRLAMAVDDPDVLGLAHTISAPQFWHWVAMNQLDPWTTDRADLQSAIVASTVANASGSKRRFKPADFMPDFNGGGLERDPEKIEAMFKTVFGKGDA